LETNRILHAAAGWLIVALSPSLLLAQETPTDTSEVAQPSSADTANVAPPSAFERESFISDSASLFHPVIDTVVARHGGADTIRTEQMQDTLSPSIYQARTYISTGPSGEIKKFSTYFLSHPGPIGSPAIPVDYLNIAGVGIEINGLPFQSNGIYRPYVIGTDLNVIPWEILNEIESDPYSDYPGLNFIIGPPKDRVNRSDVDVSRGPYGYAGTRWRFFRPFGQKTYAYFTLGFKKSDGFISSTDYNGYHIAGGLARKAAGGELSLDLWTNRARTGLLAFDFVIPQESRQSRTVTRSELRFNRSLIGPLFFQLTGFHNRTDQTVTGYGSRLSNKYDIGGGEVLVTDSLPGAALNLRAGCSRTILYGLPDSRPEVNHFSARSGIENREATLLYKFNLAYEWNKLDKGALLPSGKIEYSLSDEIRPYIAASRSREIPDLYLRNLHDFVSSTGTSEILRSYTFSPQPNLNTPVFTQASLGSEIRLSILYIDLGVSHKRIDSQIFASYELDSNNNLIVSPKNFDDSYLEIFGTAKSRIGIIDGEIGGSLKHWDNKRLPNGLEKTPSALGFGRISLRKQVFIPRLFIGGSLEARLSSRRDYSSIVAGSDDAFVAFDGRLEFQYLDFIFWLNDENLTNENYITWWPYYESPRIVWWGFKWNFFD